MLRTCKIVIMLLYSCSYRTKHSNHGNTMVRNQAKTQVQRTLNVTSVANISHERRRMNLKYSKTCEKRPLSKTKNDFQDQLTLNTGQRCCRILQGEHSPILSIFIKLPFVIKIFVLSTFEWLFYTECIVCLKYRLNYTS